jgi:CBS-domain-containing membrane protein
VKGHGRSASLLARAKSRYGTVGAASYAALLGFVVLALVGVVALVTGLPWLFPSLGPTVMLFFESPEQQSARPLNTLVGHGVGIIVGIGSLAAFGLFGEEPATTAGLTGHYLLAAAVSVAVTTLVLTLVKLPHPPAGASTLIVSLGILTTPPQLLSMGGAIVLITAVGWGLNLLLGTPPMKTPVSSSRES